jgi:arylsulfatase A-like enzyme
MRGLNPASRKAQWPVGRGFERFYGFLGAEANQWYPDLVYDNHPVEQPALPSEGYHLTVDLTGKARNCGYLGKHGRRTTGRYPLATQRNPMWLVVVSIASAWRAAGR